MLFLIELVAQNVAVGMVPTSPVTIQNGMTDETETKTVTTTCTDAMMSAVVTVLKIVEARETALRYFSSTVLDSFRCTHLLP